MRNANPIKFNRILHQEYLLPFLGTFYGYRHRHNFPSNHCPNAATVTIRPQMDR
jgi:hypothetical protein